MFGVLYIPNSEPLADIDIFSNNLEEIMDIIQNENKYGLIMGDMNIDLLTFEVHRRTDDYLNNLFAHGFLPVMSKHNIIFILEILRFPGLEMTVLKHPQNFLECISMRI